MYSWLTQSRPFSELSEPTLETAVRVLAPEGVLTLLHVVEWLPVVTEGAFGVYPHRKDIEQLKALSLEKLDELAAARPDVRIETKVAEGKPASAILEEAGVLAPDLIVIGSHGRSGLDHLLIGSVAERVLRKSPTAVLVVRAPGGPVLESRLTTLATVAGDPIGFVARAPGAVAVLELRAETPDGDVTVPMHDDGRHGDGAAGDGLFGASDRDAELRDGEGPCVELHGATAA